MRVQHITFLCDGKFLLIVKSNTETFVIDVATAAEMLAVCRYIHYSSFFFSETKNGKMIERRSYLLKDKFIDY